VTQFLQIFR